MADCSLLVVSDLQAGLLAILAKSIAIAIAILGGKSIAIQILLAIFHHLLLKINFDFCCCVQLSPNFGLTTDYVIMWSTQNLSDKQIMLTCYFCSILFTRSNKRDEKILCI